MITGDLGAVGTGAASPLLRSEDLWLAADGFAQDRAADRAALRSRLDAVAARTMHDCDTARHQLDHLLGWRGTLLDGADWATQLHAGLAEHVSAVDAARDALDARRAEQRAAEQALERVLEQRNAAAAAIEEADAELADLAGSGMDESGLRRELEAAGQAVREAREAHDTALARLEELQIEATGLRVRREEAQSGSRTANAEHEPDPALVVAVRSALAAVQSVMIDGEVDREADALAVAWTDLTADLDAVGGALDGPSEAELDEARRRVEATSRELAELDSRTAASAITPEQRAALDAAHAAVLDAEDQTGRRRGASSARRRLEAARAAERALLDEHGFGGYLDVVLTGGRSAATDPSRSLVEREHFEATLALEALERAGQTSPELSHLRSERARLLQHVTDLLGVDPGTEVLPLLRAHRPVAAALQTPLVDALAAVDIRPVGVSLEAAAIAFLDAHPQGDDDEAAAPTLDSDNHIELAAVEARAAMLEGELVAAEAEVDRTGEALQLAERSVGAFEGELTVRAGEDLQRMKRFSAAEQLRAQIAAVAATLRRAEADARDAVDACDHAVAVAETEFDQAATEVSDLARQARKLAEELPIDQRPEGDPLRSLPDLAERLRAHAEVLQPEIDRAEAAVAAASVQLEEALAASRLAGTGDDGPLAEDLVEGLQELLEATPGATSLLVLDEPFVGVDLQVRGDLLEVVRTCAETRQIVLLTEDAEVLGWAIELPVEEGTAIPADALLARLLRANQGIEQAAPALASVDITTTTTTNDPHNEPAPTARRWAGQR